MFFFSGVPTMVRKGPPELKKPRSPSRFGGRERPTVCFTDAARIAAPDPPG